MYNEEQVVRSYKFSAGFGLRLPPDLETLTEAELQAAGMSNVEDLKYYPLILKIV